MQREGRYNALASVIVLKERYANHWSMKNDSYWLARLMQEVGELASAIVEDHEHPPETELLQIASICLNWLEKRDVVGLQIAEEGERDAEGE